MPGNDLSDPQFEAESAQQRKEMAALIEQQIVRDTSR
jgi:hypothetical protein